MALIYCPFCGQKISDLSTKCIYCGNHINNPQSISCPECNTILTPNEETCPNCGCPIHPGKTNSAPQKHRSSKKIVITIVLLLLLGLLATHIITDTRTTNYTNDVAFAIENMISSAIDAEECGILIIKVWKNSIWRISDAETDPYTKENGYFVSTFDEAIHNLYEDDAFSGKIDMINDARIIATEDIQWLNSPPNGYEFLYDDLNNLYEKYMSFTGLVVYPTGSYYTYSEDFAKAQKDFVESANTLSPHLK